MVLKFEGRLPASVADLVGPQGRIKELAVLNGEDYSSLDLGASRFKVTAADGIEIELEVGAPKPDGPPSPQETAQWMAELAAYVPAAVEPGQGFKVRNEYDAGLIAIAEVKKRQGWDSGFSLFRPEKSGTGWYVQFNHHTDFVREGQKMRSNVHVDVWVLEDGRIFKYEAAAPRVVSLE